MTETAIRHSYKWLVDAPGVYLMVDYVFADNADEAVSKAYEKLEISPEVAISVKRIPDETVIKLRLN